MCVKIKCREEDRVKKKEKKKNKNKKSTSAEPFEPNVNIDFQLYFLAGNSNFLGAFLATLPQQDIILP